MQVTRSMEERPRLPWPGRGPVGPTLRILQRALVETAC